MPLPADGGNVKLGKGSLLLDTLGVGGVSTGLDFSGNVTALEMSADVQKVTMYSSTQRSAPKIAEDVVRTGFSLVATMAEWTFRNLQKFLLATEATKVQSAAGGTFDFDGSTVFPGRHYPLGARKVTNVQLTYDTTNAGVEGTDFRVLSEFGLIEILKTGNIPAGVDVSGTFDKPALIIDQLVILQNAAPQCHLLYLSDDANNIGAAAHDELEIWRVNTAPEGSLNVISDDYGTFQISMAVVSDAANHPDSPFGTLNRIRI